MQSNLVTFDVVLSAFALMSNHYHLLLRTKRANLSRFAQRLNTSYGLYYRYKHGKPGHVFQGRYKAKLVGGDDYLLGLTRYIHLNPVKTTSTCTMAKHKRVELLEGYAWSSHPEYVSKRKVRPWVNYEVLRGYGRSRVEARRRYRAYSHAMVMERDEPLRQKLSEHAYALRDEEFVGKVEKESKGRRRGDGRDRDVNLPVRQVSLGEIDCVVAGTYGISDERL